MIAGQCLCGPRRSTLGTLPGSVEDPVGDDNGPGTYTYPTDGAFNPGSFDLTGLDVYRDGDLVRFVIATHGEIHNPWGGSGMSPQRLNIYVRDGSSAAVTPMLPGTNTFTEGAWTYAIVADGRYADAAFSGGVYDADHRRVGAVTLDVDPSGSIVATVPAAVFAGSDLAATGYQVAMFSDAEDGEGVGNVRPIYSAQCAQGIDRPDFVGPFRGGGGAGSFTDQDPSRDTDTSDSNAFDLFTGARPQPEVMDWTRGPVIAPYLALERAADPGTDPGTDPGADPGPDPGADPGTDPTIVIAGGTVAAGGKVTVTGAGFAPTESLQVTLHSDPVDLALAASDAWGAFSTVVTVPRDTPPGAHRIEVRGAASGSAWANLTVTAAAAPTGTLAVTGADVPILLLTALALLALVAGAALRHVRSRLERHRP
ncbi:glucodextranase DOMON-like domain-containing protein [Microbacterium paulum]